MIRPRLAWGRCPKPRSSSTRESPQTCGCLRCRIGTPSRSTATCAPGRCGPHSIGKLHAMARAGRSATGAPPRTATTSGRRTGGVFAASRSRADCRSSCSSSHAITTQSPAIYPTISRRSSVCFRPGSNARFARSPMWAAFMYVAGGTAASTSTGGSSRGRRASRSSKAASRQSGTTSCRRSRNPSGATISRR
jgi:hypothetical protein